MSDKHEILSTKDFRYQKRRACLMETDSGSTLGNDFDASARRCRHLKPNNVTITNIDLKLIPINECLHPNKHLKLTEFCQPLIDHINERYP